MAKTKKPTSMIPVTKRHPAKWHCLNGHTFTASYDQVSAGFQCPTCEAPAPPQKRTWVEMFRAVEAQGHSLYEVARAAGAPEAAAREVQAEWDAMKARGEADMNATEMQMFGFIRATPTALSFSIPAGRDNLDASRRMWPGGTYRVEYESKAAADEHEALLVRNMQSRTPVMIRRIPGGTLPKYPADTILVMVEVPASEPHGMCEGKAIRLVAEVIETMEPMGQFGQGKSQ